MIKECGHPPNPPDDKDETGQAYESCYQCFMEDMASMAKAAQEWWDKRPTQQTIDNMKKILEWFSK